MNFYKMAKHIFDSLDAGHAELLKEAKALGDYLLVGIHDDKIINRIKGVNYPLMNLHERVLSVLSCRVIRFSVKLSFF